MTAYPPVTWIAEYGTDQPSFSADGTRVVYRNMAAGGLYVVPASEGGSPCRLLPETPALKPSSPDWSWSPETIAFAAWQRDRSTIWLIDSDGSNLRELPNMGTLRNSTYPSWYQSGKWIAVLDSGNLEFNALWRLTVDGSEDPVLLTPMDDFCAGRPSVAPGDELAPVALAGKQGPFNHAPRQIWIVRPPCLQPEQMDARQGRAPSWSPDGRWIIFESNQVPGGNFQIFIAPAPGADVPPMDPRPLTDPSYKSMEAKWSRQQDRIVFRMGFAEAIGIFEVPEEFR